MGASSGLNVAAAVKVSKNIPENAAAVKVAKNIPENSKVVTLMLTYNLLPLCILYRSAITVGCTIENGSHQKIYYALSLTNICTL